MSTLLTGSHAALTASASAEAGLQQGLAQLEGAQHPLRRVTLFLSEASQLTALLSFDDARQATLAQPSLKALAAQLGATHIDLGLLDKAGQAAFERTLTGQPSFGPGSTLDVFAARITHGAGGPLLQLQFDTLDELAALWARTVAEGALFVATPRPTHADTFRLTFQVGAEAYPGSTGRLVRPHVPGPHAEPGLWLDVTPSEQLAMLFDRRARERKQGRPSRAPDGVSRAAPRYETALEVAFTDLPELADQWATDISHGGMFVRTPTPPNLRDRVKLRLTLPGGAQLELEAEVVHRVISGRVPGVGVQFIDQRPEALDPIRELVSHYERRTPRVLVVDDEAIWRSTLARALGALGCEVQLAADGKEGLMKLIDGYFELDLVILDLHMPNLDGRGLIERIRKQGGDSGLKLFLFSAAGPDELSSLAAPGLATGVFSKLESIDALTARIAKELGIAGPQLAARAA